MDRNDLVPADLFFLMETMLMCYLLTIKNESFGQTYVFLFYFYN